MFYSMLLFSLSFFTPVESLMIDCSSEAQGADWYSINDGVMGGRSEGGITKQANSILFSGDISLENNGGFSSIRYELDDQKLEGYSKVRMTLRGDGRKYGLMLEQNRVWFQPYFRHYFEPGKDFQTLEFDLADFDEIRVGDKTGKKATMDRLAKTFRVGIILFDKKEGPFELEIQSIEFL
ncbi:MAG: CIA30 family protein [Bacteroidota bacterium]